MRDPAPGRLRHRVGQAIARHPLWSAGHRVAIAVSGGLDSMVLLDLLVRTRAWHGAELSVVTVDHGIRPGSAADAELVQHVGEGLGVAVASHPLTLGPGTSEAEARSARYAVFDSLDVDRVALAHHEDDQAETVLLHLLRGTGSAGMAGMAWRRGRYVRPLLEISRADLRGYARHRGLSWNDDPSNADPRHLRNRVRAEVLPLLEDLRPGSSRALARSASIVAADDALLDALLDAVPESHRLAPWPLTWLTEAPAPLVRRALLRAVPTLGAHHLDDVLAACHRGGGEVSLPQDRSLCVIGDHLVLRDRT